MPDTDVDVSPKSEKECSDQKVKGKMTAGVVSLPDYKFIVEVEPRSKRQSFSQNSISQKMLQGK